MSRRSVSPICGVVCCCGARGEPLACGYKPGHEGDHSWGTLPTFVDGIPVGRKRLRFRVQKMTAGGFGEFWAVLAPNRPYVLAKCKTRFEARNTAAHFADAFR